MTERSRWHSVRRRLAPYGRLERVENAAGAGTPDVCYCLVGVTGWFELKHVPRWPVNAPVRADTLTQEQADWLLNWEAAGGIASLILSVERIEFVLTPRQTRRLLRDGLDPTALRGVPAGRWLPAGLASRPADTPQLVAWLTIMRTPGPGTRGRARADSTPRAPAD